MIKKIFSAVLLVFILVIFTGTINAQNITSNGKANVKYHNGGVEIAFSWTGLDSSSTYYSDWFDISLIDAQTIYATSALFLAGTTDTMSVVLQGISERLYTSSNAFYVNLDTFKVVGATTLANSIARSDVQQTLTPTAYAPYCRLAIIPRAVSSTARDASKSFQTFLYARINDYMPPFLRWGTKY